MRLGGVLGLALTVLVLLSAPASALAGAGFRLKFEFASSNGYRIVVGGNSSTAAMTAAKSDPSNGREEWSSYLAHGKISPTAIEASFGDLGSVAMRFHPSAVTYGKRYRGCDGADHYTTRTGVFVGTARFQGEGGYTAARGHRVKGTLVTPHTLKCTDTSRAEVERKARGKGRKSIKQTWLSAFMRSGLTATFFGATERQGKVGYLAEVEQTVGSLGVSRGVFVDASPATFAFDSALSFAAVRPPAPFSGSGSVQRDPTGVKSWTGSLAVSFPGAPDVPLTGPGFDIQLSRSW